MSEQNRVENVKQGHRGHLCDQFSFRGARGSKIERKTSREVTEDSRFVAREVPSGIKIKASKGGCLPRVSRSGFRQP
eukprot:3940468-Rhodomonas_salina.3